MEPGGRAGHVPSAVHQPVDGIYREDGSFRPAAELRDLFAPAVLNGSGELITYCTIGGRAATAWFVLTHLLGRQRVRVYDGSWAEWGRTRHSRRDPEPLNKNSRPGSDSRHISNKEADHGCRHGKLEEFLGRFVSLGATFAAGSVVTGHHLGLYRALAGHPASAAELAERTGTNSRYVAEWLRGQAAGGYVDYDPATDTYSMTEEQAFALANPDGGVYVPGAFVLALGMLKSEPRITEAFRTGGGMGWHEHDENVSSAASSSSAPATSPT